MADPGTPLVSCIMPTAGRHRFVPRAIDYFLRQTYANRELVILDDGSDPVGALVPDDPRIRYERLDGRKRALGLKRNLACEAARGDVIVHWDDDDWMAEWRIAYQVQTLLESRADACGLDRLLFLELGGARAWEYTYIGPRRPWLAGGTLCYTRDAWRRQPFPEVSAGEDTRFVWSRAVRRAIPLPDTSFYVALIHPGNTSRKRLTGRPWRDHSVARVREVMAGDWAFYAASPTADGPSPTAPAASAGAGNPPGAGRVEESRSADMPVYWFGHDRPRGNFGDMLSPLIVAALSRRPVRHERRERKLLAVGSVLKWARRGDQVWGTGFMSPGDACDRRVRVAAVRGPLTRAKLLDLGVDCPEIYGDPGLLLPWLYRLPAHAGRGIGIIPHYVDAGRMAALAKDPALRVIDILGGVERVLEEVSRCEILLSSSLHGCVVGDAYGIPTAWVRISDRLAGGTFKFEDYYAGTGREAEFIDWRRGIDLDAGVRAALAAPRPELDLERLLRAFPFRHPAIDQLDDLPPRELEGARTAAGRPVASHRRRGRRSAGGPTDDPVGPESPGWSVVSGPARNGNGRARGGERSRLAVFSAGTEDYLPHMVTALRSFSRHADQPPMDYYILGRAFSDRSRHLLQRFAIGYIDLDLSDTFPREAGDRYPSECFWIFKGPEIFHSLGYAHSLSVDGDVWCNRRLDLAWLPRVAHLAGVDRGSTVGEFLSALSGYPVLKEHFGIHNAAERRRATQSGVIFYNHPALAEIGFFDRIAEVYRRSEEIGVRRGGDDSTLALLLAVHTDVHLHLLDSTWNAYRGLKRRVPARVGGRRQSPADWIRDARIVHLAGLKPWAPPRRSPNPVAEHFIGAWRGLWQELEPRRAIAAPRQSRRSDSPRPRARSEPPYPVRCYWYRGSHPNFGDELAPYLIRKVAGLSPRCRLPDRPADPRRLTEPVFLSAGSILRLCGPNSVVWGSGIRDIDQEVQPAKRFVAVRGPLTRRRLLQLGYDCPERFGDPGLLLPRYYRPDVSPRYALGIIPHQIDYDRLARMYAREDDVLVVDVRTTDIEGLIRQVLSCASTVSSALHGLVVSAAYGIPTRWLRVSTRITGDGSKYYDFFASLDPAVADALDPRAVTLPGDDRSLEPYRPIQLDGSAIPPRELIDRTFRHEVTLDLDALLDACPITRDGWKPGVL